MPGVAWPTRDDAIPDAMLLADEMGLGKTIEAVAALRILALQRRVAATLVVVPAGLVPQWRRAIATRAPELRVSVIWGGARERAWRWMTAAHVYLTSYDTLVDLRTVFTTAELFGLVGLERGPSFI